MRRTLLVALLMVHAGLASAQRGIVGLPRTGTPGCCANGGSPHGFPPRGHLVLPLYPFWYEDEATSRTSSTVAPPQTNAAPLPTPSWPTTARAQVLDVPASNAPTAANPQRCPVFVLKDGTRIHSQHYLLTTEALSVSLDQQERRFPFSMLDVNETLAVNRAQGLSLRIPTNPNEVVLGF